MRKALCSAVALCSMATAASAVTLTVTELPFTAAAWNSFNSANTTVVEDFEQLGADLGGASGAEYLGIFETAVGDFSRNGGQGGSGGTVNNASFTNTGEGVALRSGNVFGRTDTTSTLQSPATGNWFFDSNDVTDVKWDIDVGSSFNKLIFSLTDAADQGARFSICLDGASTCDAYELTSQSPSSKRLVEVDFGGNVSGATLLFQSNPRNDGYGIDDIAVSAVPLPAGVFLLGAGIAGFGVMRRKQKARQG